MLLVNVILQEGFHVSLITCRQVSVVNAARCLDFDQQPSIDISITLDVATARAITYKSK